MSDFVDTCTCMSTWVNYKVRMNRLQHWLVQYQWPLWFTLHWIL